MNVRAQGNSPKAPSCDICGLIDETRADVGEQKYSVALEKLLKAESIASENLRYDQLWRIKNEIGIVYANISNFGEALGYFKDSYAVTKKIDSLHKNSAQPLLNIGILFNEEKKYRESLDYTQKAYDILQKYPIEDNLKKSVLTTIAAIYNKLGNSGKSIEILEKSRNLAGNERIDFLWKIIYAKALLADGQLYRAKKIADRLFIEINNNNAYDGKVCHSCLNDALSKIYAKLEDLEAAISYSKRALQSTDELIDRIDFYGDISDLYLQKKEYKTALKYRDSVIQTKDSLSARINRHLYEANKVKFKISEFQNELDTKKKQQMTERKLFFVAIIFGIITLIFLFMTFKNKSIKQKQQTLLEQERLKNDIAAKNRALSAKALYLANRNELINDIVKSLETNDKITQNKETTQQIKAIKNFLRTNNDQEDFIKHFESINPLFLKKLKELHPRLTSNDIRFLCYIFMNQSLKEISSTFNITYDACRVRRNRIAEKMNVDLKEISLYDYLLKFA